MFVTVTTTITTQIDIDTLEPDHSVSIEASDDLPTQVIYAAVQGGCKATLKAVAGKSGVEEDDSQETTP